MSERDLFERMVDMRGRGSRPALRLSRAALAFRAIRAVIAVEQLLAR